MIEDSFQLHEDLIEHFDRVLEAEETLPAQQHHQTHEVGHGRKEQRFYYSTPVPDTLRHRAAWRGLASVGCVVTATERQGKEVSEMRYYISDQKPNAKRLAQAARSHWSIENGQHWVLDIAFREDDRRQQDRHGAAHLATVRRLAVSLLRQDKTIKNGAKVKRMKAALDPNYLRHELKHAKFDA